MLLLFWGFEKGPYPESSAPVLANTATFSHKRAKDNHKNAWKPVSVHINQIYPMKSTIRHECQPRDQIKHTARAHVERKRWNSRCRADVIWEIIIVVCSSVLVGLSGLVGSVGGGREGGGGGRRGRGGRGEASRGKLSPPR